MRIHSDALTVQDFHDAVAIVMRADAPRIYALPVVTHGSRSRKRAFEVALRGDGGRHKRRPNSGSYGAAQGDFAATYDDWGYWLAELFRRDPNARVGSVYNGRDDFHARTAGAYLNEQELATRCGGARDCPPLPAPVIR